MTNANVFYNVTGRYMDGQKLVAYHLVGADGSQAQESKERVIFLIGKGMIANMRIQIGENGDVIPRGKGVNLNKLPVFDVSKQQFRNNQISQEVANSGVSVNKSSVDNINPMGQYKILRRIMFENKCLAYEIQEYNGRIKRVKRDDVINLALQRLISNAVVNKTVDADGKQRLVLRGAGCILRDLPYLILTKNGKIIDPAKNVEKTIRCTNMKRNGVLRDTVNNTVVTFKAGDCILCAENGDLRVISRIDIENKYSIENSTNRAICDDYINSDRYFIEIFGAGKVNITKDIITNWKILKAVKTA